jgi:hypothetical protein
VLADDHLVAGDVPSHLCSDLDAFEPVAELRIAVAAEHEKVRVESLALLDGKTVDKQPLAFANAILLASELDDGIRAHDLQTLSERALPARFRRRF